MRSLRTPRPCQRTDATVNILASPLPDSVCIGEASVAIRTGYRTGIQVSRVADSGLPETAIMAAVLRLYFPAGAAPADLALQAALEFHRCGKPPPKRAPKAGVRVFDWDHDAGRLLADFRREYRIDLADAATRIHWWVFMAYFEHLSVESEVKQAIYYRGGKPKDLKGDDAKRWREMARAYELPPKTQAEAIARDEAMWGAF